jgi:sugar lactone lactonase YvrE
VIFLSACTNTDKETNSNEVVVSNEAEITPTTSGTMEASDTDLNSVGLSDHDGSIGSEEKENVWEEFCKLDTGVCGGILFDKEGNMLVGRPGALDKVSPDGTVTTLCDLSVLEKGRDYYFKSPFIWDMKYDKDNNIIAAAQDRIVKITNDGRVTDLIKEDFSGFLGASGLEIDQEGNIYVVSGGKVYQYSPDLVKSEFINSSDYDSFFSIAFSPDDNYLYLSDFHSKALVKYEINSDGSAGECVEIVREPVKDSYSYGSPLNMIFDDNGNMYVSIDGMANILKVDQNDNYSLINMNKPVGNHIITFGNIEFGEDLIYFTSYSSKVYKFKLDEDNDQQ